MVVWRSLERDVADRRRGWKGPLGAQPLPIYAKGFRLDSLIGLNSANPRKGLARGFAGEPLCKRLGSVGWSICRRKQRDANVAEKVADFEVEAKRS